MKNWIRRALGAAMALTLTAGLLSGCGSAESSSSARFRRKSGTT